MDAQIETGEGCRRTIRFEIPSESVDKTYEEVVAAFGREAKIRGFRPGKAPRPMVESRFADEIAEEVRDRATRDAFSEWLHDADLEVVALLGFDDVTWQRGELLRFSAGVEIEPEVGLPEYRGVPIARPSDSVADSDIDEVVEQARLHHAEYRVEEGRPLGIGDYAVVNYTGVIDGKPITDLDPEAEVLAEGSRRWIEISDDAFLPGFGPQLAGMGVGDRRQALVDIPAEFGRPQLAGRKATFFVELVEIRARELPEIDDDLARKAGAEGVDDWRTRLRGAMELDRRMQADRAVRAQVVERLLAGSDFPLPESQLSRETRRAIRDIVTDSQRHGVSRDRIEEHKDELFGHASRTAEQRLRLSYVLRRIAAEEKIETTDEEFEERIRAIAEASRVPPAEIRSRLEKNDMVDELRAELQEAKTLDFVISAASVAVDK